MTAADRFRAAVEAKDVDAAMALMAPDVTFRSPVVFRPYEGVDALRVLLRGVAEVFEDFRYTAQTSGGRDHALVFSARVGDRQVDGVDLLHEDGAGRIDGVTVLVRPLSGLTALAEAMQAQLA